MLLITGATGNVGRPLITALLDAGEKVRAISRNPSATGLPDEVEVHGGDLSDPPSLAEAFDGVTGLFINPAAVGQSLPGVLELAVRAGVGRLTVLSSAAIRDDLEQQTDPLAFWHDQIEKGVAASGIPAAFLRPEEFASNTIQQWGPQITFTGSIHEPYPEATSAVIDERDIAEVAAAVMVDDSHNGSTYHLTGPQSLTRREMVEVLAERLGRPISCEEVPESAALEAMVRFGVDAPIAEAVIGLRRSSVGHPAPIDPAVPTVTGRPATTFGQWAADHTGAFT